MQPSLFSQKYNLASTIAIYCPNPTPRKDYVFNEIFKQRAGMEYKVYENEENFIKSDELLKISYNNKSFEGIPNVVPSGLLNQSGIDKQLKPETATNKKGNPVLFPLNESLAGCDVFSMTFWLLSRYEEYQPFKADRMKRFPAAASVLYQKGILELPVLDIILAELFESLGIAVSSSFQVFPTLDIDMGFYYHGKNLFRKIAIRLRGFLKKSQIKYGNSYKEDPYYTFNFEKEIFKKYNQKNVRYFFLHGPFGKYDKNISFQFEPMRKWAFEVSKFAEVGIHPSYQSNYNRRSIATEKKNLEKVIGHKIDRSRQHYLILKFSEQKENQNTYFNLIKNGITHDYSMGYADATGFRAGTAKSFRWYNFCNETPTSLVIHPFCLMDVTLKNYLGLNPEKASEKIKSLKSTLQKHRLPFCFIFHNESLSESGDWKNWRELFELCLQNQD